MQFRMIARRAPSGSITVLGDLAQATGPWTYAEWGEIRAHLPDTAAQRHEELTLGYRAPGRVLDFASRLLPLAAPGVTPTSSIRAGRTDPTVLRVDPADLASAALAEARSLADDYALVAVITPDELAALLSTLAKGQRDIGVLDRDAMTRPVTIVAGTRRQGPGIRCRRRRGTLRVRWERATRASAPLRRHYPPYPAPEHRPRLSPPRGAQRLRGARSPTIPPWTLKARWP